MDFAALPPEINSGRIYAGAGAAPLLEAGQAWQTLAQELTSAASDHVAVVGGLTASFWIGPSAAAFAAASGSLTSWLTRTAEQAAQTAVQAEAAAGAFEAAFAATVSPAVIAANRGQLMVLVATNFLGVNTAAIAANEAMYGEMWAQDAATMYAYQAESAAATAALPTFVPAPQVTNPTGVEAQTAATAQATTAASSNPLLQFIQTLIPGFTPGQPLQNLADLLTSPLSTAFLSSGPYQIPTETLALLTGLWGISAAATFPGGTGGVGGAGGATVIPEIKPTATIPPKTTPTADARFGAGERIGRLSVPPSWAANALGERAPTITPLQPPGLGPAGRSWTPMPLGGLSAAGTGGGSRQSKPTPEYGIKPVIMPRHPWGG
jgi:PPE-repeat protein